MSSPPLPTLPLLPTLPPHSLSRVCFLDLMFFGHDRRPKQGVGATAFPRQFLLQINVLPWNASPQKPMPPNDRVIIKNIPLKAPHSVGGSPLSPHSVGGSPLFVPGKVAIALTPRDYPTKKGKLLRQFPKK
ncbi:MAG: hypothetical protein F6J93_16295 [Oscillatoria sp. SIO1A7]|nr:hypothetical protein [Oscillatoria sp. SIO1A7]